MSYMTQETRQAIGYRIRQLRKEQGLSQERLALMVGVERAYLAKVELGSRNATIDVLEKIATGLGITLADLFDSSSASPTNQKKTPGQNTYLDK